MVIHDKKQNKHRRFQSFFSFLNKIDFLQLIAVTLLLSIGVAFIYSTGQQVGTKLALTFWKKQLVWIAIGFSVWGFLALLDYRYFKYWSVIIYAISLFLLVYVLYFGILRYGARRWIQFGGLRLQPSELGKISVLLMISSVLSLKNMNINKITTMILVGIIAGIPFLLILKEPDLGSSLVLIPVTSAIAFVAKVKWRWIISAGIAAFLLIFIAYFFILKDYQRARIDTFLHPEKDIKGKSWNSYQSELAVGSGGISGKGYMNGTQNILGYLPQTVSNTDFIFSVIAEETGFIGAITVIFLYTMLMASALRTAIVSCDLFGRFVAVGIAGMLFTHTFVNIGMSIRLMPITGLPLPLVSYGGSFIVITMFCLGLLQSIYARRNLEVK
jgi:rod shape determining protein RodA